MAVTLVPGLSSAITALWEFAGAEADIWSLLCDQLLVVLCSFLCMLVLDKRKNTFTIFTTTQIMDRILRWEVDLGCVHQKYQGGSQKYLGALVPSVPGPAGYHCVTLGQFTPALTDSHHGQITPIIMLQSPDSQQITRTLSMEIEYR